MKVTICYNSYISSWAICRTWDRVTPLFMNERAQGARAGDAASMRIQV